MADTPKEKWQVKSSGGYHGPLPSDLFKNLILGASCNNAELRFEVSRMNNYRVGGLYGGDEHIMSVNRNEFPERTVRRSNGGIEAIGWRESLERLISLGWIEPNEEIRTYLGNDSVVNSLAERGPAKLVAEISSG